MNGHAIINIETDVKTNTTVNVNGHNLDEVLDLACDLSHEILEQISSLRNQGRIGETEDGLQILRYGRRLKQKSKL